MCLHADNIAFALERSAGEALQFLRSSPVDLVLVDLVSSSAEGFEFLQQLQKKPAGKFHAHHGAYRADQHGGQIARVRPGGL